MLRSEQGVNVNVFDERQSGPNDVWLQTILNNHRADISSKAIVSTLITSFVPTRIASANR
jgi:hypothetical protein